MLRRSGFLKRGKKPLTRRTKLRDCNPKRKAKKKKVYSAHLKSKYWSVLRSLTWQRDGGVCQQCGHVLESIAEMQLAHRTYARFGHEHMDDVECNCAPCNQAERAARAWYAGRVGK